MKHTLAFISALLLAPQAAFSQGNARATAIDRQSVAAGWNGKPEYERNPTGDRIPDFSHAGDMGGGIALPLPVCEEGG